MRPNEAVDIADQRSRKRAVIAAAAVIVFLGSQVLANPFFGGEPSSARLLTPHVMWAVNAVILLLILATGGGLLGRREIRALVNDEVSRSHSRTATVIGYWVAMATAMGVYVFPPADGRAAVYLVVTSSVAVAVLTFAYLENRAHLDA
jgi:hypothetical protein